METASVTYWGIDLEVEYEFEKGEKPDYGDGGSPGSDDIVMTHFICIESDPLKTDISDLLSESVKDGIEAKILENLRE